MTSRPKHDDWPLIVIVLIIAAILMLASAVWTALISLDTREPAAGVALGLGYGAAAVLLFAAASGLRKLHQIEYHLRGTDSPSSINEPRL